jgi:adenine phosphoribosyltransferase
MLQTLENQILQTLRDVPDFPKPGIIFKDITPILSSPQVFSKTIDGLVELIEPYKPNCIVGIEARGFIFGAAVALKMGLPFVPVRKPGKLPWKKKQISYTLEYGEATIEVHEDALEGIAASSKVAIIDDLLATGGTTQAACELINAIGGQVGVCAFVVELGFLNGRKILEHTAPVGSLAKVI